MTLPVEPAPSPSTAPAQASPSRPPIAPALIAGRAYEIWEREGRPEGRQVEHWLRAERELAQASASPRPRTKSAAPRPALGHASFER